MDRVAIAAFVLMIAAAAAALWRARPARVIARVDPSDFGLGGRGHAVAGFTSPMCHACQLWTQELRARGVAPAFVDVSERPELAERYGVHSTPAVLLVDTADGSVLRHFHGDPRPGDADALRAAVAAA